MTFYSPPAFPTEPAAEDGMTVRHYAAIHLMAGILAGDPDVGSDDAIEHAVMCADKLLRRLGT